MLSRRDLLKSMFGAGAAVLLGEAAVALGTGEGGVRLRDRVLRRVQRVRQKIRARGHWMTVTLKDGTKVQFDANLRDGSVDIELRQDGPDIDFGRFERRRDGIGLIRQEPPKPLICEGTVDGVEYFGEVDNVHSEFDKVLEWDADDPAGQRAMALYGGEIVDVLEWTEEMVDA